MDSHLRTDGLYFFKRNPLFGQLGDEILARLVNALKPFRVEKGSILFREGDVSDGLFLLQSGRGRIVTKTERGEDKTVAYLSRGDTIGELALLTGEPHSFAVVCDTTCDLLLLPKPTFDKILEAHPLIGIHLSRALSRRLAVSFHPPQKRQKQPQVLTFIPGLPHEAFTLFTVNLTIALVEQTRRKVLLLDMTPKSGDLARALGLASPLSTEAMFREDDLANIDVLRKLIVTHPSGLEILSLHPKLLKTHLFPAIPSMLSVLKDHYDFVAAVPPAEADPLSARVVKESDKALLVTWDQAINLGAAARSALDQNIGEAELPVINIFLHDPASPGSARADYRVPWLESFHQPFRDSGHPYLSISQATPALAAIDRIARGLGGLRVGLAMGSGAAYGYTLVGLLKVFEREGIPIDVLAGTSMGALLGSFYCAGNSPARVEELSLSITKRWLLENTLGDLTLPHSGFLAGKTLTAFLRSVLGNTEIHQMPIPFAAVATDIRSGHEVVIKEGRAVDAVRASTSLPILFDPFLHKGRYLVDGGLVNPVPTSTVANMGADILISVNLTAKPSVRRGLGRYSRAFPLAPRSPSMIEVFTKTLYTMQYEIAQARTEIANVVIAPDCRDFLWTDFHRCADISKIGEAAAEEAVSKIKSLLPFFSDYCRVPLDAKIRAF
jgi:NTE family protein